MDKKHIDDLSMVLGATQDELKKQYKECKKVERRLFQLIDEINNLSTNDKLRRCHVTTCVSLLLKICLGEEEAKKTLLMLILTFDLRHQVLRDTYKKLSKLKKG